MPKLLPSLAGLPAAHQRRLTWAVRGKTDVLKTALARDTSAEAARLRESLGDDPVHAVSKMIMEQADPTTNKRFTPWLVQEYADGRLILEDLGAAYETLTSFQRYAARLKPAQRDIQRYGSLASAWEAVRDFAKRAEAQSNRAQKALDRAQAYAESHILRQDPDGFTVAVPLTEFAAKWWGRGTRWCTAAGRNNQFWQYHEKAPLLVILIPVVGKFQLWMDESTYQFADAKDEEPPLDVKEKIWPYLEAIIPPLLCKNGLLLGLIPPGFRTEKRCWIAVGQNGAALKYVPEDLRTEDLCRSAVAQNGWALKSVPSWQKTKELCTMAISQNGLVLQYVPIPHQDGPMRLLAVRQNWAAIQYISPDLRSEELCQSAVEQDGRALECVPSKLRSEEICRTAVAQSGDTLQYVPPKLRTYSLCCIALARDGWALYDVPHNLVTAELRLIAVAQDGRVLRDIPEELRDEKLCHVAVAQNWLALMWVPFPFRTEEICRLAITQDMAALADVPEPVRSRLLSTLSPQQPKPPLAPKWGPEVLDYLERAFVSEDSRDLEALP